MIGHGELIYGLAIAVDIENFSKFHTLDQYAMQAALGDVLDLASQRAGLDRETWYRQVRGDGELAVLPADTDVAWVVACFARELSRALCELRAVDETRRLRLRVAMHHGTLTRGRFGPVGQAPIVVCRLLDAHAVRRALAQSPDNDLALVVSAPLFHDVVETRFYGLDPSLFSLVRITAKGTTYTAYLSKESGAFRTDRPVLRPIPHAEQDSPEGMIPSLNVRLIETG